MNSLGCFFSSLPIYFHRCRFRTALPSSFSLDYVHSRLRSNHRHSAGPWSLMKEILLKSKKRSWLGLPHVYVFSDVLYVMWCVWYSTGTVHIKRKSSVFRTYRYGIRKVRSALLMPLIWAPEVMRACVTFPISFHTTIYRHLRCTVRTFGTGTVLTGDVPAYRVGRVFAARYEPTYRCRVRLSACPLVNTAYTYRYASWALHPITDAFQFTAITVRIGTFEFTAYWNTNE